MITDAHLAICARGMVAGVGAYRKGVAQPQNTENLTPGYDVFNPDGAGLSLKARLVFDGCGEMRYQWSVTLEDATVAVFRIHQAARMMRVIV